MKDSYKGRRNKTMDVNIYEIAVPISKLIPDTYYPSAYLITKVDTVNRIDELKRLKEFETELKVVIEENSKIRHLTNDESYKTFLNKTNDRHRLKLIDIQKEFDKFN